MPKDTMVAACNELVPRDGLERHLAGSATWHVTEALRERNRAHTRNLVGSSCAFDIDATSLAELMFLLILFLSDQFETAMCGFTSVGVC